MAVAKTQGSGAPVAEGSAASDSALTDGALKGFAAEFEPVLAGLMQPLQGIPRLGEAMAYSLLDGGKRLRPFLLVAVAGLYGVARPSAMRAAAAIEMVHSYSLIHDDLPCMDDDVLRRGRATCHVRYDEATAVLAGDALLTAAFAVLADPRTDADPACRIELVRLLSGAAGARGMVGGQMLDLLAEGEALAQDALERLHGLKTGAMIVCAVECGAVLGRAPAEERAALCEYARLLGLAFQVMDDVLDVSGTAEELGKTPGKDAVAEKSTFVSLLGVDGARAYAGELAARAAAAIETIGGTEQLRAVADYIVRRRA